MNTHARLILAFIAMATCSACAGDPPAVTEYPEGRVIISPPGNLIQCSRAETWDWKWCANPNPD